MADIEKNHERMQHMNYALSCPMALYRLDSKAKTNDFFRLKTLGVPWYNMPGMHPADRIPAIVIFAASGMFERARFAEDEAEVPTLRVMPTMVAMDPALAKKALDVLETAAKYPKPSSRNLVNDALQLEVARAVTLLMVGRREEGIASLQSWLDKNPKAPSYKAIEQQVESLLGVGDRAQKDGDALARCAASDEQVEREIDRLFDADGVKVVSTALAKLDPKCAPKANAVAAWNAAVRGDCASAKGFIAKAGDQDVAGVKAVCE